MVRDDVPFFSDKAHAKDLRVILLIGGKHSLSNCPKTDESSHPGTI